MLKKAIGSETKAHVNENGEVLRVHWDDTYSSSIFPAFTIFLRREIEDYLKIIRVAMAEYLAFCELDEYETYRYSTDTFVIGVLKFLSDEKLQAKVTRYVATRIKKGTVMTEIKKLEKEIAQTENLNRIITTL